MTTETLDFEACMNALEQIVLDLEKGELSLEDSLKQYERGVGMVAQCNRSLSQAKLRIEELKTIQDETH